MTVSAETSGRILSFPVEEGDSVYAGQQVAQIDSTMLMLQLAQLGSQRQSAISSSPDIAAQVASVKAQIAHAEEEKARVERLFAAGAATQKQYDDAAARLSTLQGQIQGMTSTLSKTFSSLGQCFGNPVSARTDRATDRTMPNLSSRIGHDTLQICPAR